MELSSYLLFSLLAANFNFIQGLSQANELNNLSGISVNQGINPHVPQSTSNVNNIPSNGLSSNGPNTAENDVNVNEDAVHICNSFFNNQHIKKFCEDNEMRNKYMLTHNNNFNQTQYGVPYDDTVQTSYMGVDSNHQVIENLIDNHTVDQAQIYLWDLICTRGVAPICHKILE